MPSSRGIDAEPLLKAPAVARMLAVSTRTVYVMSERGDLPSVKIGRAVRFDPAAIRRFVATGGNGGAR